MPWRVESGSPGIWIEDSGVPTVILRIDPSFRREAEAMVAAINAHSLTAMAQGMLDSLTINHPDRSDCFCRPVKNYTDPVTGTEVWVHRYVDD